MRRTRPLAGHCEQRAVCQPGPSAEQAHAHAARCAAAADMAKDWARGRSRTLPAAQQRLLLPARPIKSALSGCLPTLCECQPATIPFVPLAQPRALLFSAVATYHSKASARAFCAPSHHPAAARDPPAAHRRHQPWTFLLSTRHSRRPSTSPISQWRLWPIATP